MTKLDNPMSFKRLGRRACQACVSSSPSKIPYVGFSPVRLQTGFRPQPSSRDTLDLYAASSPGVLPLWPLRACLGGCPHWTFQSRGPWLASRLCCPARSSLTMASSEPLGLSCRLMYSSAGLCHTAETERSPNLLCVSFSPCHLPYPGGPDGCIRLLLGRPS